MFYKQLHLPGVPVPLRKIADPVNALLAVTYLEHMKMNVFYEEMREVFRKNGKESREVLLFHGTTQSSLEGIINEGFKLDSLPQQLTLEQEPRRKTSLFGPGVYLTPLPALALMYGNGLLLCKVRLIW